MQSDQYSPLSSAGEPTYLDGRMWENWKVFEFNYVAAPDRAPWGELSVVNDVQIGFELSGHFINYLVQDDPDSFATDVAEELHQPLHLLLLSTTNSAHSLSELMSFLNFYRESGEDLDVAVNSIIVEKLPFLYGLLRLFLPADRIVLLDAQKKYFAKKAWLRRNTHMNMVMDFASIPYEKDGDMLTFDDPGSAMAGKFIDDPVPVNEMAARVHADWVREHGATPERVMLLKTADDAVVTTPGRAMSISPELRQRAEDAGLRVVSIGDFGSVHEYLATLYGAKVFITSYGGPACTNRFFCSPDCRVIVLANEHYKWEYEYPSDGGDYWHIRHSHLFTVAEQIVLLDHSNEVRPEDLDRIVRLAGT